MTKLLEVQGIFKNFGGLEVLNDLNFHLEEGEVLGLIGPNGAGKSTTFNIIMGELTPDKGKIIFEGKDITELPTNQRVLRGISRTYQIPRPFRGVPIFESVRISSISPSIIKCLKKERRVKDEEIKKIMEDIGLHGRLMKFPHELTMGDLRRVELAKILVADAKIVLLDEIFAGLTFEEIAEIEKLLKQKIEKEGLNLIVISHDLKALAPIVDRVIVINFGHMIAEGTFDQVIKNKKVKEAYLG